MLAHELRNPLAPLRNMLEIMKRGDGNGDLHRAGPRHDGAAVGADGAAGRRPAGREPHHPRQAGASQGAVELAAVIHQAVEACRPLAEAARHELHRHAAAGADLPARRPGAAGPGVRQPAQQRLQVHRAGRPHLADRRAAGRRRGGHRQGHRHRHPARQARPASSRCSRRSTGRWSGRRADWASA